VAENDLGGVSSPEDSTLTDRRRPRRVDYKNAHLLDLLRRAGRGAEATEAADNLAAPPADSDTDVDALAPARGVLLGSLIGALAWIAIGLAIWLLY